MLWQDFGHKHVHLKTWAFFCFCSPIPLFLSLLFTGMRTFFTVVASCHGPCPFFRGKQAFFLPLQPCLFSSTDISPQFGLGMLSLCHFYTQHGIDFGMGGRRSLWHIILTPYSMHAHARTHIILHTLPLAFCGILTFCVLFALPFKRKRHT